MNTLVTIFSDFSVHDVDFQHWDRRIAIFGWADHYLSGTFVVVSFNDVKSFRLELNHESLPKEGSHQWLVHECTLEENSVVFYEMDNMPRCEIVFADYEILPVSKKIVRKLRPDYRPGGPLMTEGIYEAIDNYNRDRAHS